MADGGVAWAIMGGVLALVGRLLAEIPTVVEWHRNEVFPRFASFVQPISGASVGTTGEVLALLAIGLAAAALVRLRWKGVFLTGFVMGVLIFGFYMSFGLAYHYPPLSTRLAPLPPGGSEIAQRLVEVTERSGRLLALASGGSVSFAGSDALFLARINSGLRDGAGGLPVLIEAAPLGGIAFGPAKLSRVSFALSRLQLSGYYFPWTGEPLINAEMPRTLWPRVAAHEGAHQRGFARENEATVMGLLTCLNSPDPTVFYAGTLGLFVGFDRELARVDRAVRRRIWAGLPGRVRDDFAREAEFWKSHEGVAGAMSEKVNDAYLKAQGVHGGIDAYNETTRLLMQAIETPGLGLDSLLGGPETPSTLK